MAEGDNDGMGGSGKMLSQTLGYTRRTDEIIFQIFSQSIAFSYSHFAGKHQ
jgi:hypothetical protein